MSQPDLTVGGGSHGMVPHGSAVVFPFQGQRFDHPTATPRTSTKLLITNGITGAWREELTDLASRYHWGVVLRGNGPPTLDAVRRACPTLDSAALRIKLDAMHRTYQQLNTELYHVVRASIDISGPSEEDHRRLFQHSFPFPLDFRAVMRGGRRGLTAVTRRAVHVVSRANGHRAIQEPRVGFRALVRVYFRTVDRW